MQIILSIPYWHKIHIAVACIISVWQIICNYIHVGMHA